MRGLMKINNEVTEYLFDTGASQIVINYHTFKQINSALNKPVTLQPSIQIFTSANAKINLHGHSSMSMKLGNTKFEVAVNVADLNKSQTVLLGRDAINECPLFEPVMTQIEQIITESTNQIIKECYDDSQTQELPDRNEQYFQCITAKESVNKVLSVNHVTVDKNNTYGKISASKLKNTSIKRYFSKWFNSKQRNQKLNPEACIIEMNNDLSGLECRPGEVIISDKIVDNTPQYQAL